MSDHGTRARYVKGCRCRPCKDANAEYTRAWRARNRSRALGQAVAESIVTGWLLSLAHNEQYEQIKNKTLAQLREEYGLD